jgi:hypothetical protein
MTALITLILELAAMFVPVIMEAMDARNSAQAVDDEFEKALARGDADRLGALLSSRFDRVRHGR